MYFYPCGTHISWPTPSALLLIPGWFHPKTSFFTESSVTFIICHAKTPLFCVKTSHITKRPHRKLPHFCHEKTSILFLVYFVTERPLFFKCLMHVSLYKSCAPGYLHPLSILCQSTSVSPTHVLPRSIMQGQRPSGTRRAVCTQSLPRQLYSRTHNARLKFRNKWTRPIVSGLQKP